MVPNESIIPLERIESLIYLVRGQKVMLDRHLPELYGVETRALNQAVRRNQGRFPEDFMFCLTREEIMRISQIVTSSQIKYSKFEVLCRLTQPPEPLRKQIASMRASAARCTA